VAKAERGLRNPHIHCLHVDCQVHNCANIRKKTLSLIDTTVTSVVRTCLSLNFGSCMSAFRSELRCLLKPDAIIFRRGRAPVNYRLHRKALFAMCRPGVDRASKLQRIIIDTLANGNPDSDRFEHWCDGCCRDAADCSWKLQTYLVASLAGAIPKIYSRSRWTHQEHSLEFIGMLEGIGRLFSRTYERFAARLNLKIRSQHAGDARRHAGVDDDVLNGGLPHANTDAAAPLDGAARTNSHRCMSGH